LKHRDKGDHALIEWIKTRVPTVVGMIDGRSSGLRRELQLELDLFFVELDFTQQLFIIRPSHWLY